jgi:hypothetical protein
MTIILFAANKENAYLVGDQRITFNNGQTHKDNENKLLFIKTPSGALGVGFAGLASAGQFRTRHWLNTTIHHLLESDSNIYTIPQRISESLDKLFQTNIALKKLRPEEKRLSLLIGGYLTDSPPLRAVSAMISNFQDFDKGTDGSLRPNFNA